MNFKMKVINSYGKTDSSNMFTYEDERFHQLELLNPIPFNVSGTEICINTFEVCYDLFNNIAVNGMGMSISGSYNSSSDLTNKATLREAAREQLFNKYKDELLMAMKEAMKRHNVERHL